MKLHYALVLLFVGSSIANITQEMLDDLGENLEIEYRVVSNVNGNNVNYNASITLVNNGDFNLDGDWEIYFSSFYMIEYEHFPNPDGYLVENCNMKFFHVNGGLYKFSPGENFEGIDDRLTCLVVGQHWSISKTDVMPNWYITSGTLTPVTLVATVESTESSEFKDDFPLPQQYKRYADDRYDPFNATYRYNRYEPHNDVDAKMKPIVPTPWKFEIEEEYVKIDTTWKLYCDPGLVNECDILKDYFKLETTTVVECGGDEYCVSLKLKIIANVPENLYRPDAYFLRVDRTKIILDGETPAAVYYGIQSLQSLNEGNADGIPLTTITDLPRFEYRGMHVDVARNFQPKEKIIQLIEVMGMYKLNRLHFHVTDDEGWRVEIDSIPELTSVGGKRGHDPSETKSLIPQLGSGPTTNTSGSGFYTKEDYQEILRAAVKHHVVVIPKVDLPGHSHAAVKANLAYYNRLMNEQQMSQEEAAKELISDLDDKSVYYSVQLFTDNAVNPCIPGTYTFVDKVSKAFWDLHEGIQNLTTFHLGGDEVADAWTNSTKCEDLFNKNTEFPSTRDDLLEYFIRNATQTIGSAIGENIDIGLWEDGALSNGVPFDRETLGGKDILAYAWQTIWEWEVANRAYKLANAGYKVVLAQATHLYFDQPQEPDPEERGLYWASRFTDCKKTFGFMPDNVYSNSDFTREGDPFPPSFLCATEDACLPLEESKTGNIIGMQGNLFSETILTKEYFDYMVYPRILAMAERAWHRGEWEAKQGDSYYFNDTARNLDWANFALTLGNKELKRLGDMGIKYRVPLPGVTLNSDLKAVTNCEFPGLKIRATIDSDSPVEQECGDTTDFTKQIKFETKAAGSDHGGYSRSVTVSYPNNGSLVGISHTLFIVLGLLAFMFNR